MTAISSLNTGLTLPADAPGFTLPTGALIPFTDPTDTQESSIGTTKAVPVLRIFDRLVSLQGDFDPATSTPNLTNSAGASGYLYHVTTSGGHDFGAGTEYLVSGWDVLHDGRRFNVQRHFDHTNTVTPQMFGAIGDGVTDDSTAIQAAANFCDDFLVTTNANNLTGTKPTLYFPPATYMTSETITVLADIRVYMDGQLLYTGVDTTGCLVIGETGAYTRELDYRLQVYSNTISDWANELNIGIRMINFDACTVFVRARGFTIGAQAVGFGLGFAYNDVTFGRMVDNKYALDCTNSTSRGSIGWCNENIFRNGRIACSSAFRLTTSRYGVRIGSLDGTNMNNNHNVYDKLSHEIQTATAPAVSVPYLIEGGNQMKIVANRSEGNGITLAIVAGVSSDNEFEFMNQTDGVILESGTQEGSSRLFHQENISSKDARLIFDSDFIGETTVAYNSTQMHIPKCNVYNSAINRQTGVIATNNIGVFETAAFAANNATNELISITHNRKSSDIIYVTGSDLPNGLTADTKYYAVGVTGNTRFQLSTTLNGAPVSLSDDGTGRQVYFSRKGWVQLPSNRGVGVTIDTSQCKHFLVERNVMVPTSGGRVAVTVYDASGAVLGDNPDDQYVKGNFGFFWRNTTFGGSYGTASDNEIEVIVRLRDEVKSAEFLISGGTDNVALRQFKIYSLDLATSPTVEVNYQTSWEGQRFATQAPDTGVYEAPLTLWNDNPTSGNPLGWQLINGGVPGTWVDLPKLADPLLVGNGMVTPQFYGAQADGLTNDSIAIQTAFDSSFSSIYFPSGIYRVDNVVLSVTGKRIWGEGDLRLIDNATTSSNRGMFTLTGSGNIVDGLIFRGNLTAPPSTNFGGQPMRVSGDGNLISNCKFYDAKHDGPGGISTTQDNVVNKGDHNTFIKCQSFGALYSLFSCAAQNSKWIDCYGRRGTGVYGFKGFNAAGGSSEDGIHIIIDGINLDDVLQLDWASENSPKVIETVILKNCIVNATNNDNGANLGCKLAHVRNAYIDHCHFATTGASQEGLVLAERTYNVTIRDSFIKGGGGSSSSSSHIQSFGAGKKHRTINNFSMFNTVVGGTKENPDTAVSLWDQNAIDVRAFSTTIKNCKVNNFLTRAFEIYPEEFGVSGVFVNTPPTDVADGTAYIVGESPNGAWVGRENALTFLLTGSTWLFEDPDTDLFYDTRVYDETSGNYWRWREATEGWHILPDEEFKLDITDNKMVGWRDGVLFGVGSPDTDHPSYSKLARRSDRVNYYNNELINLTGSGTQETDSSNIQPVYQQLNSKSWWGTAAPTQGIWFQMDHVQNFAAASGVTMGWMCVTSGVVGLFRFGTLPTISGGGS